MDQRTKEWLDWRRGGLGSSDIPIVMGVSPWKTPYQLWEDKTGRTPYKDPAEETNFAQERGNRLEPKARREYELLTHKLYGKMILMPADIVIHPNYPMFRASMDGISREDRGGLEIKCPGKKDHETAMAGRVPDKYYPQVQWQIYCGQLDWVDYYSYTDVTNVGVVIRVKPDPEFIAKMEKAALAFWDLVINDEAPPLSKDDYILIRSTTFKQRAVEFRAVCSQIDALEERKEQLKKELLAITDHPRAIGYGVKIVRSKRKGGIDYGKVPELQGVNLEQYRKPFVSVTSVQPCKEDEE